MLWDIFALSATSTKGKYLSMRTGYGSPRKRPVVNKKKNRWHSEVEKSGISLVS